MAKDPISRLRELCMALPDAFEKLSHGEATWFASQKGKVFANTSDHHHDDRLACWCAAPPGEQQALVAADPSRFFVPPYVGGRGWVGVYLDVPNVDWEELAEIVEDAYRFVASKRLIARLDAAR